MNIWRAEIGDFNIYRDSSNFQKMFSSHHKTKARLILHQCRPRNDLNCGCTPQLRTLRLHPLVLSWICLLLGSSHILIALLFKSAAFCLQHIAVNVLGRMSNAALLCKMSLQSSLCEIAICSSPTKHSLKCIPPNLLFQKLQSSCPMHYPHAVLFLGDCNPDYFLRSILTRQLHNTECNPEKLPPLHYFKTSPEQHSCSQLPVQLEVALTALGFSALQQLCWAHIAWFEFKSLRSLGAGVGFSSGVVLLVQDCEVEFCLIWFHSFI